MMLVVAEKRERLERVYVKWQQRLGSTQHQIVVRYLNDNLFLFSLAVISCCG